MHINWFLIFLAYAGLFVYGLVDNARGPVYPDILSTFTLTDAQGSVFFFLSSLMATVANATAFYWLKRWHAMKMFLVFAIFQSLGLALIAISPSYPLLLSGSALFGLSMGGLGLLVNVFAANATGNEHRRRAMSGLHGMYGISSLLAPLVVTLIYRFGGGWRAAIGGLAFLPLLVGIAAVIKKQKVAVKEPELDSSIAHSISIKAAWPFIFMIGCYVIAEVLLSTRLVLYARRDLGYSADQANLLLAGYFMAIFAGRMLFAFFSFNITTHRLLVLSTVLGLIFNCIALWIHPIAFIGCGFAFSFFYPSAMAEVGSRLKSDQASVVMSWIQTFQSIALMAMHFFVGVLSDRFGLARALWFGIAALVIVLFCLWRRVSLGSRPTKSAM